MTTKHVVVDGSNIATEGRSMPSLQQLDEAVKAFLDAHPHDRLTVVVDATFGHRIDTAERAAFEEAVEAGELISPPAGVVGRGDAFVLEIADRAGATVLSNDSFQEFHGEHPWLFDPGRLIGGKPVPDVGWVFLERLPVRGPASRKSVQAARKGAKGRAPSKQAPAGRRSSAKSSAKSSTKGAERSTTAAKPAKRTSKRGSGRSSARGKDTTSTSAPNKGRRAPAKNLEPVNDALPFIEFVGAHPVGSLVEGTVDQFTSHGAYIVASGARCYLPLKSMGDPPPRSARDVLTLGETRDFVLVAIDTPRRGLDIALPDDDTSRAEQKKTATLVALVDRNSGELPNAEEAPVTPAKRTTRRKAPAKRKAAAKKKAPAKRKAPARKKAPARRKAPAKRKKAPAKKRKAPAKRRKAPAKRKKAPAKRKKAPAKKRKAPAKRKKAPAKKRKAPAKRKAAARRKAPAKRKAPARRKKASARRR